MANESTKWLYDQLKGKGYNVGKDVNEFDRLMRSNADSRKWAYETATKSGLNVGKDIDEFSSLVGGGAQTAVPSSTPANPVKDVKPTGEKQQEKWQPTPLQRAFMIDGIQKRTAATKNWVQDVVDNSKRVSRSLTQKGRDQRKAGETIARAAGKYVKPIGLTPTIGGKRGNGTSGPRSPQSPVVNGVRVEDGEVKTEYMLPDGSLTTDFTEADRAEYTARSVRLQHEFEKRMLQNGLDPTKQRDVEKQRQKDLLDESEKRVALRLEENEAHLRELSARKGAHIDEEAGWNEKEGFWDNMVRILGSTARRANERMHSVNKSQGSLTDDDRDTRTLLAENSVLNEARKRIETRDLRRSKGFMGGFWNIGNNWRNMKMGASHTLSDPDLYGNGVLSLEKATQMLAIEDKLKRGEDPTDAEVSLLYSTILSNDIHGNTETPHGYNAAQITVEMFPFMAQMMLNPASGLSQALVKKFGKSGLKKIALTIAGDVAESAVLANTLQTPATAADAIGRYQGEAEEKRNAKTGKREVTFDGTHNWGTAIGKAEGAAVIENYTEMLGEHFGAIKKFAGKLIGKGVGKLGGGKILGTVTDLTTKVKTSEWGTAIGNLERRAHWNGTVGEVLEEEAGIVLNSMFTGDNKLSDLVDADQQIDIVLGVGLFGGFVSGLKTLGYPMSRARAKNGLRKADGVGGYRFGDAWDGIRSEIENAEESALTETIKKLISTHAKSTEQQRSIVEYASALMKARGMNLAIAQVTAEGNITPEQQDAEESFSHGESIAESGEPEAMRDVGMSVDRERQRLVAATSEEYVAEHFDKGNALDNLAALDMDDELRGIALDYVNAKQVYDGMIQGVRDDIDFRIAQSDAIIDSRVNRETGQIYPAIMKIDNRPVYIVNGKVTMLEDGTGVDRDKSSESLIIRDAETGKIEFADPSQVLSISEGIDPETEKEAARNQITQEIAQVAANNIDGVLSFVPGESYSVLDLDGNPENITILGNSNYEDGQPVDWNVDIQYPDGSIQSVSTSDLQQWVDEANDQRVAQFAEERAAERAAADEAERQADETGLSNPNRNMDFFPDNYQLPYYDINATAARYIESERGTGGILYQDKDGNDALVISAIDENSYIGYFREYDKQGNPTNRWSAKFQNGSGLRENHRDMMQTAQKLLPAGHELTEHTSVSTDGLRNLANQLKHGYELQYDEHGNVITNRVAVNMMAKENDLGLPETYFRPGREAKIRIRLEEDERSEVNARLAQFLAPFGLDESAIHWKGNQLLVDHPVLRRADTPQQEADHSVPKSDEIVLNSEENAGNEGQIVTETVSNDGVIDIPSPDEAVLEAMLASEEPQPSALSQIPTDEKGDPIYEQAEPETAWDALMEETEDEQIAQNVIAQEIAEREDALKKLEKQKLKAGLSTREKIQAEKDKKKAMDDIRRSIDHWKRMSTTKQRRKAEADAIRNEEARRRAEERKVQEEQERAEREEAERQEREALNGVPDWSHDTPQDARARGYRRFGPEKVDRQEPLTSISGKDVEVKFGKGELPKGKVALIDVSSLQPSHIDGMRNPRHFLDEAQPKERTDAPSREAARKIASNIRPEEITSSVTAYTGAPTVNSRGETIQGNSRSDALRTMYESYPKQAAKYKQYLIDHAAEFGLTPEQVEGMEKPVLVNMLDVADDEAIRLGQFVAQDTESGGIERIKPKNAVNKMGNKMRNFANILLRSSDDEASLSQLVDANGVDVLKWMAQQGFISDTQYTSAFDSKGHLTGEAANDLKRILYHSIFTGGSTRLEEMFNNLPAKAQRAILATAFRDYDSDRADRMVGEIQQSIMAYNDMMYYDAFASASNIKEATGAMESWKRQYAMDDVTGEPYLPAEKFSNFALALAAIFKGGTQRFIQQTFNDLYDTVQGTIQDTLFEEADKTPKHLAEAIKKVLDLEYQPIKQEETNDNGSNGSNAVDIDTPQSETGGPGSDGNAENGEREPDGGQSADSGAGTQNAYRKEYNVADPIEYDSKTQQWAGVPCKVRSNNTADNRHIITGYPQEGDSRITVHYSTKYKEGYAQVWIDKTDSKTSTKLIENLEGKGIKIEGNGGFHFIVCDTFAEAEKYAKVVAEVQSNIDNGSKDSDLHENIGKQIKAAEKDVNLSPSEAQKKAGNYKKGHVQVGTFDVTIENPKGSKRSGIDPDGKKWETTMTHTYGYIRGTEGVDGDHIDVYLSSDIDDWDGRKVFVVDQYNPDGTFDEHKVMLGFNYRNEAYSAYLSNYEKDWEKGRRLVFSTVSIEDFEKWIESSHRKQKPFKEYKSVHIEDTHEGGKDELHDEVRQWLGKKGLEPDETSRSAVMRYFKIGYNRAGKILNAIAEEKAANQQKETTSTKDIDPWNALDRVQFAKLPNKERMVDVGWEAEEFPAVLIAHPTEEGVVAEITFNGTKWKVSVVPIVEWDNLSERGKRILDKGMQPAKQREYIDKYIPKELQEYFESGQARKDNNANPDRGAKEKVYNEWGIIFLNADTRYTNHLDSPTEGYTIVSKPYTTKQDNTLDTHLVSFDRDFSKDEQKRIRSMAKEKKGWQDRETGGYMLRSREDAEEFAASVMSLNKSSAADAPVSLSEIESAIKPSETEISSSPADKPADKPADAEAKPEKKPSKWVDEEDAEEFERLRNIMRNGLGQLNMGFPPELLYAGAKMSYLMMKHGVRKFAEYAAAMIEELGDAIRPHLKALYNFTRSTDEVTSSEWAGELTPFDEVMKFDTANFDKGEVSAMAAAENVVAAAESQQHLEDTVSTIKETIRQNPDGTTTQTINEGGTEIEVTEGDFIPGVYPPVDDKPTKPGKKKTSKPKPTEPKQTTGQLDLFGEEEEQIINDVIEDTTAPEPKPEAELSGDSADYQERRRQERDLVDDIVIEIMKRTDMKERGDDRGALTMRDIRGMLENYPLLADISATDLQELVERAMTILTRTAAKTNQADPRKGYDRVVAYYNMQPSLNARDSERLIKQQYSTPTPFGYVMGQFVNAKNDVKSVLEPSAGNGALTIMFDPATVHVNDIDERRLENLRTLGYGKVTAQNGLLPFEVEKVDGVLTNPPFGSVTEKVFDGVFKISSLEGQMAINSLDSMKDGGRAAIIIGGNTSYRTNGSMNPKDAAFFGYLYSHYNVVDVINISGKALYARNGTGYDVRMILINGRKPGEFSRVYPPVKSKARAEQVTTFDELYKRVQDDIQQVFQMGHKPADEKPEGGRTADGGESAPVRSGSNRPDKGAGQRSGTTGNGSGSASGSHIEQPAPGNKPGRPVGVDNGNGGNAGGTDDVERPKPATSGSNGSGSAQNDGGGSGGNGRDATPSRPNGSGERLAVKPDLTTEKVPYPNQSDNGFTLLSVVPAAQAEVLQRSLAEIGDVDQFLVDELGYSSKEELYSYLAAEQIDSVALAIHQMNKGNAFIIGDMTGVGKGRQGAALIRYGVRQGRCPIYFTQKPTLFTDNYRDLADIGSSELRPFIIASNPKDANIVDANGNVVHKLPSKKEQERVFDYIMQNGKLPKEYDYVLTTYDQIKNGTADYSQNEDGTWNTEARKLPKKSKGYTTTDYNGQVRRDALARLAMGVAPGEGNIAILDESHTVGGDSGCGRYMQMLTSGAYGATFLSATFAKRADNMPIYAQRTAIAEAGVNANELIEAIAKGGVTLQEIMSKQLVESGQMIRRERSFEGVTIDWLSVEEETDRKQRVQFNEVANIFNSIRNFQNEFIKPIIDGMNEAAAEQGATVGQTQGTKDLGVRNTPFASKMYNLVNQLLFALKVDAVADRVIENLRNGFKPVISFTNTMEGFLASAPKGVAMDEVPNFSLTLMRALDGVMRFTENDADQNSEGGQITLSQLSPEGQKAYNEVKEKIMNLSADLPISPMDAIRMKIEEAGYTVAEITGRTTQLNRTEDGRYIVEGRKDRDKKAAMRDFNAGKLDVLMINKSGSTGISLHASSKFEDQRQRVMVFAQFQSDINDEVQMRGRIDRSGQVVRGRYEYIMSTIPAEQRIQMMFKAKLKSLDANTTSSQKSKFNEMEIVDYLNKYGDEVVWEYMKEHPELSERLGDPLKMLSDKKDDESARNSDKEDTSQKSDCAGKISRYLAFLPVEEQDEIFKEITEAYKVKIQLLDDAGENDLEITTMPLRAETKSKQIWHKGENPGSGNAFADNTYVEEVEVDVLKKPMKRTEIEDMTRKLMGDKLTTATEYDQTRYGMKEGELNWGRYADKMIEEVNNFFGAKADDAVAKMKEAGEKRVAKAREKAVKDAIKARAKGENTFSDQEIDALADVVSKEAQDKEEIKQYRRREEINNVRDHIKHLLGRLRAGHIYVVPQDLKQATADMFTQTFGTFVGFKFNKSYTLGSSTAIFATLDGRRKVELALSDKAIDTIIRCTDTAIRYSPREINAISMENWDSKVPTQTRQTRHIITGNLLQALVDTEKGEKTKGNLISFSTQDGNTRQGILMSENFKPTDLRSSVPLRSRLKQIQDGKTIVSENGDVQIEKISVGWEHRGDYELRVPKSKQKGGVYTMNPALLNLVDGKNFVTKGNNMVGYVTPENLAKVVDMLSRSPFNLTVLEESKLKNAEEAETLYRFAEDEHDFDAMRERAVAERGIVMPNLNEKEVKIVEVGRHDFSGTGKEALRKAEQWAKENIVGIHDGIDSIGKAFKYTISNEAVQKYVSSSATKQSSNMGVHLAALKKLPEIISKSIEAEVHPDYTKGSDGRRGSRNRINEKSLVHRFYGAIEIDGSIYKVKTTMREYRDSNISATAHSYEVTHIELFEAPSDNTTMSTGEPVAMTSNSSIDVAKLLKDVEKSYDPGVKLLDVSAEMSLESAGEAENKDSENLWRLPWGIAQRWSTRKKKAAERQRNAMREKVRSLTEPCGIEVEIREDASGLEGKKRRAKGWFDPRTGKIVIVLSNHSSTADIQATLLHEMVAHKGLRDLFGDKFDAFLDAVYANADNDVKERIDLLATQNGWNRRTATEEYMAGLAEDASFADVNSSWWKKLKGLFMDFLRSCGFSGNVKISDNELRYVLWMSWQNLKNPGAYHTFLGEAERVEKEYQLRTGEYAETEEKATEAAESDLRFRDGDFTVRDRKMVAHIYENMLKSGSYQFREAVQDSMLGLKRLYQAILGKNTRMEDIAGYENAYLYENRMSSANNGEQQQYFTAYMKPLLKSVHDLCGSDAAERRILTDYMMAKHGLERNEYMRNEASAAGEETDRDFAGLCGLTGEDDWKAAEAEAQKMVDDYENDHDTTELWDNVKRATSSTLEKIYLTGLISEDTYNKVLGMYDYYIPLRGWDETTSDEVYGYLTSKDGPLMGNVFKTAEGRESKADDPIATIAMMADDAIRQGNRNVMKQRFLNFVHGNPSNLVSVNQLWLQYNDAKDEWEPVFADLEPGMTAAEVESEIGKFEAKMESLQTAEPDKYKRGRDARNIPYKVVRGNLNEHQVLVKRNGHTYVMTINGNPRAAQALNGLTNPNVEVGGIIGNMLKAGEYINRNLSAFYTTRNPDFVMSNFLRDMLYSNCITWVKENPRYALRFHKNFGRVNPVRLRSLLAKWEKGSLSDGNYLERMFKEFMLNGGETGYTSVKDIEGHKRTIAAELRKQGSWGRKAWAALGNQLDLLNRCAENCARFAAFLTSREMGRPLDRSIYDAKEISVNFNKKGSGGKFVNATGQTKLGKVGSYLGGGGRIAYVFWNAGVQGMTNFGRAGVRNPKKALTGAAALFVLGSVIPLLAQLLGGGDGDDDDKNAYYNLPEYVRRSNICFKVGEQWITIPLPIEYRAIYGMGELSTGVISGNERYGNAELARQMASQVSQILPLDMLEGGGGIAPFIPSAFKPMTEAYIMNKGWTGMPVYKDTPFNKNDPEWTKGYQSADQHLVGFAKWLNETTGGDDYKKGAIDINPAKLEYLLNGTFGGMMTFPMKIKKTGETAFGDRDFEWRNTPLLNRVVKSGDERTANRKLQNEYFKYKSEAEETERLKKKYENAADGGILAYAEKVDFLYNSNEYLRYEIFKEFEPDINAIRDEIKEETDPEAKKELQAELYATMRELVDCLHEVGK